MFIHGDCVQERGRQTAAPLERSKEKRAANDSALYLQIPKTYFFSGTQVVLALS
jgi:hypothetical protein